MKLLVIIYKSTDINIAHHVFAHNNVACGIDAAEEKHSTSRVKTFPVVPEIVFRSLVTAD